MESVRIAIVDDHEVVRRGLRSLLEEVEEFEVVAEAGNVADAVSRVRHAKPDVVVMDVRLPDGSGVEACREIRSENPGIGVLMLTSFADDEALFNSIMAGAAGYVLKQIRGTDLIGAIRTVAAGKSLLDPSVHDRVLRRLRGEEGSEERRRLAQLTEQERRILLLIAEGRTNRQIAQEIYLAEKTVKNYVSSLLAKLGMARRSEAAAFAARLQAKEETPTTSREVWP